MTRAADSRGFTLLEVALALAIVGIGVVTVFQLLSATLRMAQGSKVRAQAVVYARTLFDRTMAIPELAPMQDGGQIDERYRWERIVREAPEYTDQGDEEFDFESEITIYEVEVSVLWPQDYDREGVYSIRTLRVGPAPDL